MGGNRCVCLIRAAVQRKWLAPLIGRAVKRAIPACVHLLLNHFFYSFSPIHAYDTWKVRLKPIPSRLIVKVTVRTTFLKPLVPRMAPSTMLVFMFSRIVVF